MNTDQKPTGLWLARRLKWNFQTKHTDRIFVVFLTIFVLAGCTTTTSISDFRRQPDKPRGFFQKLADEMTERECNVGKFVCPFGFGPAGEPCDCTDPSGLVLNGRTVK